MTDNERIARLLALLLPLALLSGALGSQYLGGLYPCEMCLWQRWPHYTAVAVAGLAFVVPGRHAREGLVIVAALLIATSGVIAAYHAGVEYHWWQGMTTCSSTLSMSGSMSGATAAERLAAIMNAPVVRCDEAQWRMLGISLAGFNAILSLGGAGVILSLMRRAPRAGTTRRTA